MSIRAVPSAVLTAVARVSRLGPSKTRAYDADTVVPTRAEVAAAVAGDLLSVREYGACTLAVVDDEDGRRLYRVRNEQGVDGEWSIHLATLGTIKQ